ncbi:DUF4251 domain-containing protein [Mucilaginibacter terrenus]|nr:DUF4251 domain-containing protein [Mucilaginibacter terrenus]
MKALIKYLLIMLFVAASWQTTLAQSSKAAKKAAKEAAVKQMIEAKDFVFTARFMYPMGGGQRYIDPYYDLRVNKDTVTSFLPYWGVAYSGAGYNNPDDNGIKFTSTKFNYRTEGDKKGGWKIYFKPTDVRTVNQMILTVASNGNADLSVISNNRQQIRFDGYVDEKPKPKQK